MRNQELVIEKTNIVNNTIDIKENESKKKNENIKIYQLLYKIHNRKKVITKI